MVLLQTIKQWLKSFRKLKSQPQGDATKSVRGSLKYGEHDMKIRIKSYGNLIS